MDEFDRPHRIAISGASGFLGHVVQAAISAQGHIPVVVTHRAGFQNEPTGRSTLIKQLRGCRALINCAGRAHRATQAREQGELSSLALINSDFPMQLARAARDAGVIRFVHVSSVAALRSASIANETIDDTVLPAPTTPYGRSKLNGDRAVIGLSDDNFSVLVFRPPALYGPAAKGWFPALMRSARLGIPLPLGEINNRRSFAFVGNVANALVAATAITTLPSGAYILCDSAPLSSAQFYDLLCRAHGYTSRIWHWPRGLVIPFVRVILRNRAESLIGNAAFDASHFLTMSGWKPPFNLEQAMAITVNGDFRWDRC